MNIYFVESTRYYTLVPTFLPILEALQKIMFCDLVQLLLRCCLYLLNRSGASSFHGSLQFREQKRHRGPDLGKYGGYVVFGQKFAHKQRCVSRGVIMVQNPIFVLAQIRAFLADCLAQFAHNLQVIFLIDRYTLWQELMMHHTPTIEKKL